MEAKNKGAVPAVLYSGTRRLAAPRHEGFVARVQCPDGNPYQEMGGMTKRRDGRDPNAHRTLIDVLIPRVHHARR